MRRMNLPLAIGGMLLYLYVSTQNKRKKIMKHCKSCQKEIDNNASKCPHCQTFQKWYKNPQAYGVLFSIPVFIPAILIITSTGLFFRPSYLDHKNDFEVKSVNVSSNKEYNIHTYNITNKSDSAWENIAYQFIGLDESGKVVVVQSEQGYSWKIQPNSQSMISVETPKDSPAVKWEFKITDMRADRGL